MHRTGQFLTKEFHARQVKRVYIEGGMWLEAWQIGNAIVGVLCDEHAQSAVLLPPQVASETHLAQMVRDYLTDTVRTNIPVARAPDVMSDAARRL